ncbi:MAG: hypothetical protein WDM85_07465 [Caulobacteraceae bacterium]
MKPSVFSTANSGVRSRTDCIITAPTENSRAKNTAPTMLFTTKPMSPICLTESAASWRSLSVLVSSGELANRASMRLATALAWVGWVSRTR